MIGFLALLLGTVAGLVLATMVPRGWVTLVMTAAVLAGYVLGCWLEEGE